MKTIGLIVMTVYALICFPAEARPQSVKRGSTVSVSVQFGSAVESGRALLTWQTYDDAATKQSRDKGVALRFNCSGTIYRTADDVRILCSVPPDVADGHYYLVSLSIVDGEVQRTHTWYGDFPKDVEMNIKGGATTTLPNMKSIQVSANTP